MTKQGHDQAADRAGRSALSNQVLGKKKRQRQGKGRRAAGGRQRAIIRVLVSFSYSLQVSRFYLH